MGLKKTKIRYLIFDLDDTLFDTYGLLVKPASEESCRAMIAQGLNADLKSCLAARHSLCLSKARSNLYKELVKHFGARDGTDGAKIADAGFQAFHDREIKENIVLFPDSHETLDFLGQKFKLYLVTLGAIKTQKKKVELLGLAGHFQGIFYSDVNSDKNKRRAFQEIMSRHPGSQSDEYLAVGNRIDSEIREAKELGMQTVLMEHGEYVHLKPQDESEEPDARITRISQLKDLLK